MKIPKPAVNELIAPAFDGILEICESSDIYNVKQNTVSLLRIYSIILTSGILQSGDDFAAIIDCMEKTRLLERIEAEIDKNHNMSSIKDYISEIAMRALANEVLDGNIGDVLGGDYEMLTSKIAEAIDIINNKGYGTQEERIDAMMLYAQEYLGDYGINVPTSIAKPIAEVILEGVGSGGSVSAQDIQNFLNSYLSN
jgi:hypothetical protein